jgi:hypothetical protein
VGIVSWTGEVFERLLTSWPFAPFTLIVLSSLRDDLASSQSREPTSKRPTTTGVLKSGQITPKLNPKGLQKFVGLTVMKPVTLANATNDRPILLLQTSPSGLVSGQDLPPLSFREKEPPDGVKELKIRRVRHDHLIAIG